MSDTLDQVIKIGSDKDVTKSLNTLFSILEDKFLTDGVTKADAQKASDALFKPVLDGFKAQGGEHKLADVCTALNKALIKEGHVTDNTALATEKLGKKGKALVGKITNLLKDDVKAMHGKLMDGLESKSGWVKAGKFFENGTKFQLSLVSLIMIFRPLIMLTDTAVPMKTRRYAATREFFTELFGLINVAIVAKGLETLVTAFAFDKHTAKAGDKIIPKAVAKLKKLNIIGTWRELTNGISKKLLDPDWEKLAPKMKSVRGVFRSTAFVGVVLATAIITPFLNNYVINDKVLNGIWKALGQGGITSNASRKPSGPAPKTSLAAAQRMLALMGNVNPAQSINMYQANTQMPYASFSALHTQGGTRI